MNIHDIRWNSEQNTITMGKITIALTDAEYRLLSPLRWGRPITYADLAVIAYNYPVDRKMRMMMNKYMDRIRDKLKGSGIYVYCILGYGYLLLPDEAPSCEMVNELQSQRIIS